MVIESGEKEIIHPSSAVHRRMTNLPNANTGRAVKFLATAHLVWNPACAILAAGP
jgi:hypothetical protein